MTEQLGFPVAAVGIRGGSRARRCDRGDVHEFHATLCLEGRWLKPGMHINAIGANFPQKHELDGAAVRRCDIIAVDSRAQSKIEAGDLIQMYGDDTRRWDGVNELAEIVAGKDSGPRKCQADHALQV